MSEDIILVLIGFLVLCLIVTVAWLVLYSGLFSEVDIKTGSPPIRNVTIAYKFREGPYKDIGALYTEACSIGPKLNCIGVFYDDPDKRPPEQCRCVVGSILSEGEEGPDAELQRLYERFGFRVFSLPEVPLAVTTSFPSTTPLSHVIGPYRVYRQLSDYVKDRDLLASPYIEIYKGDLIHYMGPLSRWSEFFVPEMREEAERLRVEEAPLEENRGTHVTDADSQSGVTVARVEPPSESGETSLAPPPPAAAALPSAPPSSYSLPPRDHGDGEDEHGEHKDPTDRASTGGSVASGSSFEELDLEQIDDQEGGEEERERKEESPTTVEDRASEGPPDTAEAEEREPVGDGEE